MSSMTDLMTDVRERELGLLAFGIISPMTMPARRPVHTWTPPAGSRPVRQPAPAKASPDNSHARRIRSRADNGWWHAQQAAATDAEIRAIL